MPVPSPRKRLKKLGNSSQGYGGPRYESDSSLGESFFFDNEYGTDHSDPTERGNGYGATGTGTKRYGGRSVDTSNRYGAPFLGLSIRSSGDNQQYYDRYAGIDLAGFESEEEYYRGQEAKTKHRRTWIIVSVVVGCILLVVLGLLIWLLVYQA